MEESLEWESKDPELSNDEAPNQPQQRSQYIWLLRLHLWFCNGGNIHNVGIIIQWFDTDQI